MKLLLKRTEAHIHIFRDVWQDHKLSLRSERESFGLHWAEKFMFEYKSCHDLFLEICLDLIFCVCILTTFLPICPQHYNILVWICIAYNLFELIMSKNIGPATIFCTVHCVHCYFRDLSSPLHHFLRTKIFCDMVPLNQPLSLPEMWQYVHCVSNISQFLNHLRTTLHTIYMKRETHCNWKMILHKLFTTQKI